MSANADIRTLSPGSNVGPYEIVSFLAAGGMGEVYLARDPRLERNVAIKVLPNVYGHDIERLRRFEQEARATSRLNHPNILTIYDIGRTGGMPYIVTELLDGRTLRALMTESRLEYDRALTIALQTLAGLTAAHEKGITHRDLKPANLFVTREGNVKILDFGLAKLTHPEWDGAADSDKTQSVLSTPGAVVGSAGYMSPEQVEGATADARSDLFAFGAILYELLTGRRAFEGNSAVRLMMAIVRDMPDRLALDEAKVPPAVSAIVMRCLEKEPARRFQTARDLAYALNEARSREYSSISRTAAKARAITRRVMSRPGISVAALVAVAAATVFVFLQPASSAPEAASTSYVTASATRLTSDADIEDGRISPRGDYIAYAVTRGGQPTLRLRHLPSGGDIQLFRADSGSISSAGFTLDGNFVEFNHARKLYRIPLLGGTARVVHENVAGGLKYARSGSYAFATFTLSPRSHTLWLVPSEGAVPRRLIDAPNGTRLTSFAWSPNQRTLLVIATDSGTQRHSITEVDSVTGAASPWPLCTAIRQPVSIEATGTDTGFIVAEAPHHGGQLWFVAPSGQCTQLTRDPMQWYSPAGAVVDTSTIAAKGFQGVYNIWRVRVDGAGAAERLTTGVNASEGMAGIALLPNGSIVYTHGHFFVADLWVREANGRKRRLTELRGTETTPVVSHDGARLAFAHSDRDAAEKRERIYIINVDGSELRELVSDVVAKPLRFSNDGKSLYYMTDRLKRHSFESATAAELLPATVPCFAPVISPDESLVACLDEKATTVTIRRLDDGSSVSSFAAGVMSPGIWSPDGKGLIHLSGPEPTNFLYQPIDGDAPRQLTSLSSEEIFTFALSADGRYAYCSRGSSARDLFLIRLHADTNERR